MESWEQQVIAMSCASRIGDRVRVNAPSHSRGAEYNGIAGMIVRFEGGWVIVNLDPDQHDTRFRPDELLVL